MNGQTEDRSGTSKKPSSRTYHTRRDPYLNPPISQLEWVEIVERAQLREDEMISLRLRFGMDDHPIGSNIRTVQDKIRRAGISWPKLPWTVPNPPSYNPRPLRSEEMMTLHKAEKIIGSEVTWEEAPGGKFFRVKCSDAFGEELIETGRSMAVALDMLIRANYARSRLFVLKRDHYRCTNCGAFNALHADHVVSRARGERCDRPENLNTLCSPCHDVRHAKKGFYAK